LDYLLKPLSADWDGFSAKAHEFIAQGDRVVSLGTYSGTFKKTGRYEWPVGKRRLSRPPNARRSRPAVPAGSSVPQGPPRKTIEAEIWFAVPAYAISADFVVKVVC
jgi:hypothetical protein